jgi:CheY-like chemotaxis protein
VVQDAVNAVLPTARAKDIALQCMIQPVAGSVRADRDRLYQAVWGLVSNAIKFTPPGGQVRVSVEHRESQVEITVADSGVGIPSDLLPRLFEPFWQEDAWFSRIHGGLGLGLALVRRIVELHGGTVRAVSAGPARGATFIIALPRLTRSDAEETPLSTCIARMAGLQVLLVEDDSNWIELVVDLLTLAGARVFVEQSAAAALRRLETEHPHVALLDVSLPRMDAWKFIAGIRRSESPGVRSVRAAAVSDQPSPELQHRALAAGFQILLPRSLPAEELLDAVIRLATMRIDTTPAS